MARIFRRILFAALLFAASPATAETLRGMRGDWSLTVVAGWHGLRYDGIVNHMRNTTDETQKLMGKYWLVKARADTADAIVTNEVNALTVIIVESAPHGSTMTIPPGEAREFWQAYFRQHALAQNIRQYELRSTWGGTPRPGHRVASAVWTFVEDGFTFFEEMVFISRSDRFTQISLRAVEKDFEPSRPALWTMVKTINFNEER
ncbi:hypothetical protein [Bradyrhizobium mercantei]|uniref:hypothetical protein n=1 Tax=Bradyrhizobium mercantei TaxID=1904807 RepID=UPI0009759AEC|nr:hypothetical protein [Bradyrhizobium mercantei]